MSLSSRIGIDQIGLTLNFLNNTVEAGFLTVPYSFARNGVLTSSLTLVFIGWAVLTMTMELSRIAKKYSCSSYYDTVRTV
mmetsp:Transcript_75663/g.163735  ORF Transcript_75663/g.163735 Transcript_75663/m.163735 type:complete len:80 (-) Transcript_75663:308-547(-)